MRFIRSCHFVCSCIRLPLHVGVSMRVCSRAGEPALLKKGETARYTRYRTRAVSLEYLGGGGHILFRRARGRSIGFLRTASHSSGGLPHSPPLGNRSRATWMSPVRDTFACRDLPSCKNFNARNDATRGELRVPRLRLRRIKRDERSDRESGYSMFAEEQVDRFPVSFRNRESNKWLGELAREALRKFCSR